ncbi:MAG: response regulator, partial [Alphaproteobacteria bacterium]|nr:response regulator [Alphaproteobacteria bacterium]
VMIGAVMLWLAVLFDRGHEQRLRDVAAKTAAERTSELKSRFLAVASHDLRQPVQALALYFNVLRKRTEDSGGDGLEDAVRLEDTALKDSGGLVARMGECIASLSGLLDSLLDISKLEAGSITAIPRPVMLAPLMERLWADFAPIAEVAGISLSVVPSAVCVMSDDILLERILRNLLSNAIRYGRRDGKVLMGCRRRGDTVVLQVIDDGIGISQENLGKVFEEFFRGPQPVHGVSHSSGQIERGLGLGLSIVKRLASLLGHGIAVTSYPGLGSRFELRLRRLDRTTAIGCGQALPVETAPILDPAALAGRVVLVVDDDSRLRHSLQMQLEDWGLTVITAVSAEAALEALRTRGAPDLMIIDYRLGEAVTGEAAFAAITSGLGQSVPAILLTGETTPTELRATSAWVGRVLHKPVNASILLKALVENMV